VVLEGPEFVLDDALLAQLDLVPTPLDPDSRVYQNGESTPLAGTTDEPWRRWGAGFAGEPIEGEVPLAISFDRDWEPESARGEWSLVVDGSEGRAWYDAPGADLVWPISSLVIVTGALGMLGLGRRRS
jgi:hypothetical protein